jgi:NADH:ubiquinone oxidoreductase subunit E
LRRLVLRGAKLGNGRRDGCVLKLQYDRFGRWLTLEKSQVLTAALALSPDSRAEIAAFTTRYFREKSG